MLTFYRETMIEVYELFDDATKDKYKVVWNRHDFLSECTIEIWLQKPGANTDDWQRLHSEKSNYFMPTSNISIEKVKQFLRLNSF